MSPNSKEVKLTEELEFIKWKLIMSE